MKSKHNKKSKHTASLLHFACIAVAVMVLLLLNFSLLTDTQRTFAAVKSVEADQHSRINTERAAHGVPALRLSECISRVARQHSFNMSEAGGLYHNNQNSQQINEACGVWVWTVAENVAGGGGTSANSATLFQSLLNSPCHHANIDSRTFSYPPCNVTGDYNSQPYSHVGVGSYRNSSGSLYITQVFVNCTTGCSDLEQADTQETLADWTPPPPPPPTPTATPSPTTAPASSTAPTPPSSAEPAPPAAPSDAPAPISSDNPPPNLPLSQDKFNTDVTAAIKKPVEESNPYSSLFTRFDDSYRAATIAVIFTLAIAGFYLHHTGPLGLQRSYTKFVKRFIRK